MSDKNVFKVFSAVILAFWIACVLGYVMNVVKFVKLDFHKPYKAEVIRGIGLLPPVGAVVGYIHISDK